MKKLFLTTIAFYFYQFILGQSIYYNTISLAEFSTKDGDLASIELSSKNEPEKTLSILYSYLNQDQKKTIDAEPNIDKKIALINQFYSVNPFILISGTGQKATALNVKGISAPTGVFSSVAGLPVTTFADGLARFMVKRMKEELSVMFFDQFQRELEKQQDLRILFPSTNAILETAKSEIYNYQKFLPALREAFAYDMDEVLENTYKWTTETDTKLKYPILDELRKKPHLHNSLKIGIYIGNELDNGQHPGEILTKLTREEKIDFEKIHLDILAYLKVLDLFSQSLKSNSPDRYWITKDEVDLFQDDVFLKIYLGLIYQTEISKSGINQIYFAKAGKFSEILEAYAGKIDQIKNFVVPLAQEIALTQNRVSFIVQNEAKVKTSDYFNLFGNILNLAQLTVNAPFSTDDDKPKLNSANFTFYVNQTSFLYANIKSKAYPAAVFNSYAILSRSVEENDNSIELNKALGQYLKYGTFMATVATSESSEEVAAAIEAVALPPGSARIKREAAWNISLNSYLGGFLGYEKITFSSANDTIIKNSNGVGGVFAPVGLSFSRNFSIVSKKRVCNFSASVFASIIDIGALASFRLNSENDSISILPEIKLENIISPGLYGIIGLPRVPISIGGGYQIGPILREVSSDNLRLGSKSNRLSFFIAVDIPLVNFWTRSREKIPVRKAQ